MRSPSKRRFDTNPLTRIIDGVIKIEALTGDVVTHATHIQLDEVNKGSGARSSMRFAF